MHVFRASVVVLALQLSVTGHAAAQVPASDAPAVRPEHPRLFFTDADLPQLRDRIAKYYRSEFQAFLDLLNDTSSLSRKQRKIEPNWGGFNNAFVAALDPQEMARRGFHFKSDFSTPAAYCTRAMTYVRQLLPGVSAAKDQRGEVLDTGYPDPKYLSVVTTYDWCHAHLADADRKAIVDAYVSAYEKKYKGRDLRTMELSGLQLLGSQRVSADLDETLGILAFYGDSYPDVAVQGELLSVFKTIWLDRFLGELNYLYQPATGWHEGPGGYLSDAFTNISIPVAMFSPALGVDYVAATPFLSQYAVFVEANVRPHSLLGWPYYDRWGTISSGIAGPSCKNLMLNAGMLRRSGHPNAALAKWAYSKTAGGCKDTVTRYGGTWSNAALFWFLLGDREVEARSPVEMKLPNAVELGLGEYVMRSGYSSSDSQVIFYAQEPRMYGHATQPYGTFSLHKFGNLIVQPGNTKSGAGVLERGPSKGALFENVLTLHKGASDPGLGFTGGRDIDPFFERRGITKIERAGSVLASTLNGRGFDYVAYDSSPMWSTDTATVSEREFVYLHGSTDHEFLVVLDRFEAVNPSTDEKVWRIWVPAQPSFVNGTGEATRPGLWTSSTSDTIELTNQFDVMKSKDFRSAPTHGRFFMKTLSPIQPVIRFVGGPGMEFQSGDDDGTMPWGAPPMTQTEREYLGWGRVEVRPAAARARDLFLNIIQFGDSKSLRAMAPVSPLDSDDGKMSGAHVADKTNQWVVLFGRESSSRRFDGVAYAFKPVATGSRQLLLDMAPSTTFYVVASSTGDGTRIEVAASATAGGVPISSNDQGVLTFELNGTEVK